MNVKRIPIVCILLLIITASSCRDSVLEYRMKELEQKVSALEEGRSGSVQMTSNSQPTGLAQTADISEDMVGGDARFQWEGTTLHDFGSIKQGELVKHVFKFKNTGTEDLQIQGTSASCGCTVPEHSKDPIPPGGTGEIVVQFDSKGKSGQQNPVVTVNANTDPKQVRLTMRGFVQTE